LSWDWLLTVLIIGGLILAMWAKVSHQTIPELLKSMRDFVSDTKEDSEERVGEIIYE